MLSELGTYIDNGFNEVEGWVEIALWEALGFMDALQIKHCVEGGVAEIGVHHGRFFLGLQALKGTTYSSLAIDVFDDQDLNIDNSGQGSLTRFHENIQKYSVDSSSIDILKGDSLRFGGKELIEIRGRHPLFSIFSVDGGHTAEHVYSDLNLAMQLTSSGGLIIIDDYINPWWPGVHEGIAKAYLLSNPTFVPFFYGMNKLILTDISHHQKYFQATQKYFSEMPTARAKTSPRFGWDAVTVALPQQKPTFEFLNSYCL